MASKWKMKVFWGLIIFGLSSLVAIFVFDLPVYDWFVDLLKWMDGLPRGVSESVLILVLSVNVVLLLPGTPLNIGAGFLYGIWWGSLWVQLGCGLGLSWAFWNARKLGQQWVKDKIQSHAKLRRIIIAVGTKKPWTIVFLSRLSPLAPFPYLNYAFGTTDISFLAYVIPSFFGILPGTVLNCYYGSLLRDLSEINEDGDAEEKDWTSTIYTIVGSLLAVGILTIVTGRAVNNLAKEEESEKDSDAGEDAEATQSGRDDDLLKGETGEGGEEEGVIRPIKRVMEMAERIIDPHTDYELADNDSRTFEDAETGAEAEKVVGEPAGGDGSSSASYASDLDDAGSDTALVAKSGDKRDVREKPDRTVGGEDDEDRADEGEIRVDIEGEYKEN